MHFYKKYFKFLVDFVRFFLTDFSIAKNKVNL